MHTLVVKTNLPLCGRCYLGLRPIRYYGVIGVLHHGVSRAEFSLTEPIPLQAVYVDHSRNP